MSLRQRRIIRPWRYALACWVLRLAERIARPADVTAEFVRREPWL